MVTVYILDVENLKGPELLNFIPKAPRFDAEMFKKRACIRLDILEFTKKFNEGSLDIDDQKYYIYMEI
jgi:hypothetical protein